jgi:hypothetical protein
MSNQLVTYSGKDLNFALTHPLIGTIQASGVQEQGIAQITVRMAVNQSLAQVGMDGAVIPSVIPGDQGEIEIQLWQTSTLHQKFLDWYNLLRAARDAGDVSLWFGGTLLVQNIVDGSQHVGTGVAPTKVPDKTYAEQAGRVSWVLMACSIANE